MIILRFTFTIFKIVHAARTAVLHYFKSSPQVIPQLLTPLSSLLTKKPPHSIKTFSFLPSPSSLFIDFSAVFVVQ
jgi:hypothetical protein